MSVQQQKMGRGLTNLNIETRYNVIQAAKDIGDDQTTWQCSRSSSFVYRIVKISFSHNTAQAILLRT